jgi:hypothetical protein
MGTPQAMSLQLAAAGDRVRDFGHPYKAKERSDAMHNWTYDESKHCGVDYSDVKQAEVYDEQHQKFRNYKKEVSNFIQERAVSCIFLMSFLILIRRSISPR